MKTRNIEILVGSFLLLGLGALLFLALKVANVNLQRSGETYRILAEFDSIGGLKEGSPVKVGGVSVGYVSSITLNKESLSPLVVMNVDSQFDNFSDNSSVSILTSGLLGEKYIGLLPGFFDEESQKITDGDSIEDTHSALVLEELVGQFLYSTKSD